LPATNAMACHRLATPPTLRCTHGKCSAKQHRYASALHRMNVYGIIAQDWLPSQAALTT
jgi:hypothetical protein